MLCCAWGMEPHGEQGPNLTLPLCCGALQDGNNINNVLTVLPRDAHDNAVRERLLSPTGVHTRADSSLRCALTHAASMDAVSFQHMHKAALGVGADKQTLLVQQLPPISALNALVCCLACMLLSRRRPVVGR